MCLFFLEKQTRKQKNYINSFLWKLKVSQHHCNNSGTGKIGTCTHRTGNREWLTVIDVARGGGENVSLLNSMTCDYRLTLFWYLNDVTVSHFAIKTGITVTDRKHVQNYQNKMQSLINQSFSLRSGAFRVKVANLKICWTLYWIKIAPSSC